MKNLAQSVKVIVRPGMTLIILTVLVIVYLTALHPWFMNWGATPTEQHMIIPGDERVGEPATQFTRAITVQAPAARVWPWLVQIGQDRAGFYSNDWLENIFLADIHNGDEIRPEWQTRTLGDAVPMTRANYLGGRLGDFTKTRIQVLELGRVIGDNPGVFFLQPIDDHTTRLLLRERNPVSFTNSFQQIIMPWFIRLTWDPMHFVMEKRMLYGIQARAEGVPARLPLFDVLAHLGWALAAVSLAALFLSRRIWRPWLLAPLAIVVPILATTHDLDAALAGFLAVGITLLGVLAFGRRWLAPFSLLAAGVLLALLLAPDPYVVFGLVFLLLVGVRVSRAEAWPRPAPLPV
jgi:hypothetical protein